MIDVAKDDPTTVRLPPDLMRRVRVLAREVERLPKYAALGRAGFSKALRLVIGHGLEAMEAEVRAAKAEAGK